MQGQIITLGSGLITASAGSGGSGSGGAPNNGVAGGAGAVGRIAANYSASISGSTTPTITSTQNSIFADSGGAALFAT